MPRPKIAVIHVGGSIGMVRNQKTGRIEQIESVTDIHRFVPELQKEVSLEFFSLQNILSSEIRSEHWTEIVRTIASVYDDYEGFVVIHGTNTMSYTAAALSFALQNLSKPIVLTGSILPINDIGGDSRVNLVYAVRTAQLDLAEVCITLGPRVLRGNRAVKTDHSIFQTFETPKLNPLAEFHTSVDLNPMRTVRRKRTLVCRPEFDSNVVCLTMHPGAPMRFYDAVLDSSPHGIVIRAYGLGLLPEDLLPWLRRANDRNIPVVIVSQLIRGSIDLHNYHMQLTLEQLGVISAKNMTTECAIAKLMWALTQTKSESRLKELMQRNLVGELDE